MSVSGFLRYADKAAHRSGFLRYYRNRHAPILASFPGIRSIVLHSPVEWRDCFPINPGRFTLPAQMIFDSREDLHRALQSEARAQARADFAHFPQFEGIAYPQAVISEEVLAP